MREGAPQAAFDARLVEFEPDILPAIPQLLSFSSLVSIPAYRI
jgi:hypothetical protein